MSSPPAPPAPLVRSIALGASLLLGAALAVGCDDSGGGGTGGWLLGGQGGGSSGASGAAQAAGSLGWGQGGGGAGKSAGGSAGKAGGGAGSSQSELCAAYIECTAATNPGGLGVILGAYGATGNCWAQGDAALCDSACSAGLAAAHKAFPAVEACNRCASSKGCPSSQPACDTDVGRCVACLSDADCAAGDKPACDQAKRACVACTSDAHCTSPGAPACDAASRACVACTSDAHCAGSGSPVCDTSSHTCRSCQVDAECPSGACLQGQCAQCKTDAQCGGATPHCGPQGFCMGCGSDADCPAGGACEPLLGICCGVGVCQASGVECGTAIDVQNLYCLLTPIPCGACAKEQACVNSKCIDPPETKCGACQGACAYVPESNSYECVSKFSSCDADAKPPKPCEKGYMCRETKSQVSGEWYSYCALYCLEDGDCPGGKCEPLHGVPGLGTCQ